MVKFFGSNTDLVPLGTLGQGIYPENLAFEAGRWRQDGEKRTLKIFSKNSCTLYENSGRVWQHDRGSRFFNYF